MFTAERDFPAAQVFLLQNTAEKEREQKGKRTSDQVICLGRDTLQSIDFPE